MRTFVIRFGKLVKNKKILIVSVQSILLRVSAVQSGKLILSTAHLIFIPILFECKFNLLKYDILPAGQLHRAAGPELSPE